MRHGPLAEICAVVYQGGGLQRVIATLSAHKPPGQAAIADYSKAIEINSKKALPYNGRGNAYQKQHDLVRAITDYGKAIELDPSFAEAYNGRGLAKRDIGDLNGSIIDLDTALRINPNYAEAYLNRGIAFWSQGKVDQARVDFELCIKLNSKLRALLEEALKKLEHPFLK
jgi:tetratricopeptide (TPR) repeat protein